MILLQNLFNRELWGDTKLITTYVVIGLVLFAIHRLIALKQELYAKVLLMARKLIIASLVIYTLLIAIIPLGEENRAQILEDQSGKDQPHGEVHGIFETWNSK